MQISGRFLNSGQDTEASITIDQLPDTCPICSKAGTMHVITSYVRTTAEESEGIQVVLQCPRLVCRKFFIAYYSIRSHSGRSFSGLYEHSKPLVYVGTTFPENIVNLSTDFIAIFNQAEKAEADGLDKIAGVGFRKSFEFLIKDYLISRVTDQSDIERIKAKKLGLCISEDISSENIKSVAARANWLGNDETHYSRIWADRDINDLKQLIHLSVYWIDSEILTNNLINDMP